MNFTECTETNWSYWSPSDYIYQAYLESYKIKIKPNEFPNIAKDLNKCFSLHLKLLKAKTLSKQEEKKYSKLTADQIKSFWTEKQDKLDEIITANVDTSNIIYDKLDSLYKDNNLLEYILRSSMVERSSFICCIINCSLYQNNLKLTFIIPENFKKYTVSFPITRFKLRNEKYKYSITKIKEFCDVFLKPLCNSNAKNIRRYKKI